MSSTVGERIRMEAVQRHHTSMKTYITFKFPNLSLDSDDEREKERKKAKAKKDAIRQVSESFHAFRLFEFENL